MRRTVLALALVLSVARAGAGEISREHVSGDIFHYTFIVPAGRSANAKLRIHRVVRERAPWVPRATGAATMLLHGDFASFASNFLPGMAPFLAARGIDVWGVDRRWTLAPAEGADLSDFGGMGFAQETADVGAALAFARAVRLATAGDPRGLVLAGFSRGGVLAYAAAVADAARPRASRSIRGLVPLDVYAVIAPEDEPFRQFACTNRDGERHLLAQGVVDNDNSGILAVGALDQTAPDDPSPVLDGLTNRDAFLLFAGQTYLLFGPTPVYHLAAPSLVDGFPSGLTQSPEEAIAAYFADGAPHQSMRELADGDALWCGEAPLPVAFDLGAIRVPLFYLGAAGGFGDHGLHSTTLVSSTDVTTHVIRLLPPDREAEDFGHADLLYGTNAPSRAWTPLAAWILAH